MSEPGTDAAYPPDEVIEAWMKDCTCCRVCDLAPCANVQQGGICEDDCRCDERESAQEEQAYDPNACPGCGGSCQVACR